MTLNTRYRLLQASFWMMFCVGQGYITYYLTGVGFTTGEIGLLTAAFGLIAAFSQTRAGRVADTSRRFDWRTLIRLFSLLCFFDMSLLTVIRAKLLTGLLYGCFLVLINAMLPLVNAGCFYLNKEIEQDPFKNKEPQIDFGFARGLGSLSFAVLSFLLGRLTAAYGSRAVTVAGMCVSVAIFLSITFIGQAKTETVTVQKTDTEEPAPDTSDGTSFFRRYPVFFRMMAGLVFLLTFHNIINTYLLQIMQRVGGNSATMGTAFAIAGLCEVPTMFLFSRLKKKFSPGSLLFVSGVCYLVRVLLMIAAKGVGMLYVTELLQCVTFALYASAAVYYTEETVAASDRSSGQAVVGGVSTIGQVIGNLAGGVVLQLYGVGTLLWMGFGLLCIGTGIIASAAQRSVNRAMS